MKVTVIPVVIRALAIVPKRIDERTGRLVNKRTSRDHPDYRVIKISQNTEKRLDTYSHLNSSEKKISQRWWEKDSKE